MAVTLSKDGKKCATGGIDGTVMVGDSVAFASPAVPERYTMQMQLSDLGPRFTRQSPAKNQLWVDSIFRSIFYRWKSNYHRG